ncbi:MAG: MBL fold metallo-hydrolase [Phycisphaeraceae bacterium]|nr:MBL fold metallo-hydrolase [Phycisphaeraceae bacterium]
MLEFKSFVLGDWQTNAWVIYPTEGDAGRPAWIVDPGFGPEPVLDYLKREQLEPAAIMLTHAHVDHIAGIQQVRSQYPSIPIQIHEAEADFLTDPTLNLSAALAEPVVAPAATATLAHGQTVEFAGTSVEVRHTPGHSPGSVSFWWKSEETVVSGDALFAGSIGRTDFPGSDHETLLTSIREQLLSLPGETRVLPGHGPATTVSHEAATNPWL